MKAGGGGVCLGRGSRNGGNLQGCPCLQGSQTLKNLRIKLIPRARYGLRKPLCSKALRGVRAAKGTKRVQLKVRAYPQAKCS